ncbi:MAG TPA: hypothetical protein VFS08_02965 [Gemmatimonadaceae bacterium]|nr:hypothetical protein [Gemmatimonadaceae bacterium]
MRHFHRTQLLPVDVLDEADAFFPTIGLAAGASGERSRTFDGALGTLRLTVRPEGGHYTFVEADTDQMGESRLDRNVKKFFVRLHKRADPAHRLDAAY